MVRSGRERGQLILIGALLVAATILASITLLNAVHESPKINTQQDSQSLVEAERTVDQTKANLEGSFLANTSSEQTGEQLPYARASTFGALVGEYNDQYTNISTTEAAGIVDITFDGAASNTGGIARQNRSIAGYLNYPDGDIVQDADAIPKLYLFVNETSPPGSSFRIELAGASGTVQMEIDDNGVSGDVTCSVSGGSLEIDFENGVGEIRTDETYCGEREFGASLSPPITVSFSDGSNADGTFTITGVDPSGSDISGNPGDDNRWFDNPTAAPYIVDPAFEIEYDTPNVAYNATFSLYNTTG
jgi:hypothetical protein